MGRLQQGYEVGRNSNAHAHSLGIAAEVALRLREKNLKEQADHVQRHTEEYQRKSYLPYEVEGKTVEYESISFMRFLPLFLKSVWVCKIVDQQVDQEE